MEAVIFVGIQGAGKSTFYKERFFKSHMHINLDMVRTRKREDIFLDACLRAKQPFVIDNTNPTVKDRNKYIALSKEAGFKIIGYYFKTNIKDATIRNEVRIGKDKVPSFVIASTFSKLVEPTYEEGFDKLYMVRIGEGNSFIIEEFQRYLEDFHY